MNINQWNMEMSCTLQANRKTSPTCTDASLGDSLKSRAKALAIKQTKEKEEEKIQFN